MNWVLHLRMAVEEFELWLTIIISSLKKKYFVILVDMLPVEASRN